MQALIFGITGQDGYYLKSLLNSLGISVFGVARSGGDAVCDVSDRNAVSGILRSVRPQYIFHLAAESSVSYEYLWDNHAAIGTGTLAILDAVDRFLPESRVLLAGSALQFINQSQPLDETAELDHSSPYAVARNYSLFAARYFRERGRRVYFAYLFNHDSPLRTDRHLNMKVALAAAAAAHGDTDKLKIGDPSAEKEFNFAGDIAAALWSLIRQDSVFECVVGSGLCHPVHEWLRLCYQHVGLNWKDHVQLDPAYRSPYRRLVSNPALLMKTGWRPAMEISELAAVMMEKALTAWTSASRQADVTTD